MLNLTITFDFNSSRLRAPTADLVLHCLPCQLQSHQALTVYLFNP